MREQISSADCNSTPRRSQRERKPKLCYRESPEFDYSYDKENCKNVREKRKKVVKEAHPSKRRRLAELGNKSSSRCYTYAVSKESGSDSGSEYDDKSYIESDSDCEVDVTPRRKVKSIKSARSTRIKFTPRTPIDVARRRNHPTPSTPLAEARAKLHVTALPDIMPCRESEFSDIYNFVYDKVTDEMGGVMYIAGVPGTGKTSTVRQAIKELRRRQLEGVVPGFKFIEVSGIQFTNPKQVYSEIHRQLTGHVVAENNAQGILDSLFLGKTKEPIVMLCDEVDLLTTRRQNILYDIFDWPNRKHSKLIVLAIGNTLNLPERVMMNRVSSRLGLTRVHFVPYTFQQLNEIVQSRLEGMPNFDADAIGLAARKVASISGDVRCALHICRRAADIAAADGHISLQHVVSAIEEMYRDPKIQSIKLSSIQEKIFFRAIIAEFQRTGIEEAVLMNVMRQHVTLCRCDGLFAPSDEEISEISARLSTFGIVSAEENKKGIYQRVRLNIDQEEVMLALR